MDSEKCPCGSGKLYAECCRPVIKGERKALTAEELMRSRYSAYVKVEIPYLNESTHPSQRESNDEAAMRDWAEKSVWLGFEIIKTSKGGPSDDQGSVEFIARYKVGDGAKQDHHETSQFRKENGIWYFYDAQLMPVKPFIREEPKTGRNDPCPCGSGKKFKKCCG